MWSTGGEARFLGMELDELVRVFAVSMEAVDAVCPAYVTRKGREYQAGIGPYPENKAMELVAGELRNSAGLACGQFIPYPAAGRQKCDLWLGDPLEWVVEVKMGRFRGDNGIRDDTAIKDLISPFWADRSALIDGVKLAESEFPSRKAVLVYGFDDPDRPLGDAIEALDVLLRRWVTVTLRSEAPVAALRHPVHSSGRVIAWEIAGLL
jgi:hypothetical protein